MRDAMERPSTKPKWMSKHPCTGCGAGYGDCIQGLRGPVAGMTMCCKKCDHPTRWQPDPYTAEDMKEMISNA